MSSILGQNTDVILPTLHPGQVEAYMMRKRFKVVRCGRRWGKTDLLKTVAGSQSTKGRSVGWFTPDYKIQSEAYNEIREILDPVVKSSSKIDGVIRTITGGRIDFWTLNNPRAGRSRKYHTVLLDEVAFAGDDMRDIWEKSIKPSLLDYGGNAIAASTPNGDDPDNFFWQLCNDPALQFGEYHAPTHTNPYLPEDELAKLVTENAPLVYSQEYLANFIDWKGAAFFGIDSMLDNGQPVAPTMYPDVVFAVVDTAIKDGHEHDGTAVTYFALSKYQGYRLVILDWDLVQVKGDLLENWMPNVYRRCEELATLYKARMGSIGAFIEDKQTGTILIQQAERRGLPGRAIDSLLTAMGKDARAISVSGYVHQGLVKISRNAFDKVVQFKGITRNHFIGQVCGYRIGIKDQVDDLFDTFCYGISIALGDSSGY